MINEGEVGKGNDSISNADSLDEESSGSNKEEANLIDSVKENLESIMNSGNLKRNTISKRWWTPEEVMLFSKQ